MLAQLRFGRGYRGQALGNNRPKRDSSPNRPRRRLSRIIKGLISLGLVYLYAFGDSGLYRIYQLEQEKRILEVSISVLEAQRWDLELKRKLLVEQDPAYLEKLAREEYGMARRDEWIYRFVPPTGAQSSGQDSSKTGGLVGH